MNGMNRLRPTPAMIVAMIALVAAMSGAAVALPGKGDVTSNDIAKNAVKSKHIVKNAVRSQEVEGKSLKGNDLKDGAIGTKQLKDDAVDTSKVEADGINDADIADYEVFGASTVRVTATDGATADAAQAAAPENDLAQRGDLRVYAKCFRDTSTDDLFGVIYIATTSAGAVFDSSDGDTITGGPAAADFLSPDTAEDDREISVATVNGSGAAFDHGDNDGWRAFAADGTSLTGTYAVAVKNGSLAGGNGVYGEGNVCLFGGAALG